MALTLIIALFLSACAGNNNRQIKNETVPNSQSSPVSDLEYTKVSYSQSSKDDSGVNKKAYSDKELVKKLPGFKNGYKKVNGITLHYVEGGKGEPLFLLPGWPQTWYAYHKVMQGLAKKYHVYVVEYRGMGGSDKPASGYDKKTMASDVYALVKELGYTKVNMAGHDIGAFVAYAYAANYPQATTKLALLDVAHPSERYLGLPLVPPPGVYDTSIKDHPIYPWWFGLNSVPELSEKLLQGNGMSIYQDWLFDYLAYGNKPPMTKEVKEVYYAAYSNAEAIRASNEWYKTFRQDIEDLKTYPKLSMPVLGIGGFNSTFNNLDAHLRQYASDVKSVKLDGAGHWIAEQKPQETIKMFMEFFR
ncbi:alpha/beta hydrolase [Paenibacillus psychroresistens]|uniref:Alpha/beta hydrolase n=2 Tax=Paenibacillus psychroresistens TaxID=1778678 RepID=A0A6B8RWD8_9BACL|nr:alpha/beta hydrolase [Paenibacillus psychroresistens]